MSPEPADHPDGPASAPAHPASAGTGADAPASSHRGDDAWHRSVAVRAAVVGAAVMVVVAAVVWATAGARSTTSDAEGSGSHAASGSSTAGRVRPFDPAQALDLSGVPGVSPSQQAAAEQLVTDVAAAAPAFTDVHAAERSGYVSIGDSFTGEEHLISWTALADGVDLDPARPEALVYDVAADGTRSLAAFMFMRPPGSRVDDAPRPGGALTRWHAHGDLCEVPGDLPRVGGSTDATGACPAGLVAMRPSPTLHVWLVAHPCGPFAELEGVGTRSTGSTACAHRHTG